MTFYESFAVVFVVYRNKCFTNNISVIISTKKLIITDTSLGFSKKSGRVLQVGPEILAFGGHCSPKFQPILDYFVQNFKLKYKDTVVLKLHQIKSKQKTFF